MEVQRAIDYTRKLDGFDETSMDFIAAGFVGWEPAACKTARRYLS